MTLYRIIFCFLLLPLWCAAVQPYTPRMADPILEPWRWRYEESLDGLSAICMDEAGDGSLWFGNVGSIARYDGVSVEKICFDEELLSQITHSKEVPWAKALVVLPDGRPLVLVGESLVVRGGGTWRVVIQDVGASVFSAQLKIGDEGLIWLLVPDALWQISPDLMESSVVVKSAAGGRMESFSLDDAGQVWVLEKTENLKARLVRVPLRNGRTTEVSGWEEFPVPFENDDTEARIAVGHDGIIWYADSSVRSGLETFDPKTGVWQAGRGLPSHRYHSLIRRPDGSVIAGENGQLIAVSRLGDERVYSSEQLPFPKVSLSLFEASNDRLWVIGRIGYVYSIDLGDQEWQTYSELSYQCETEEGVQWFLSRTHESAVCYDPRSGEWLRYDQADGLPDRPYVLFRTRDGVLWVAGRHRSRAAVSIFDGAAWTTTRFPEFAHWIEPKAVLEAADGTVWLGAGGIHLGDRAGGLLQLTVDEGKKVRVIKHHAPPQVPYYITAIAQAPDQTFWLGSTVVYRYDGVSPAVPLPDLQGENTVAMVLDREQSLWVAKEHVGIGHWTGEAWEVFALDDGVASRRLSDLIMLKDGSLLASSGRGVSRFDGSRWVSLAYPEWFSMISRWSSVRQSRDGAVWLSYGWLEVPTSWMISNETELYRTVRHRPESEPPDTHITDYLERVSQPGNMHVVWKGHDPWSRTALNDLRYSWRLDKGEWSPFSRETGKTFLSLSDGRHILEVRARDQSFNVDPTPDCIEFTVIPPVWKQAWFITLISVLVGLIVLMVWILIYTRERHSKEQQAEREEFLVKQQKEREQNLIRQQKEREALLMKQQEEKERHLKEMDRVKTGFFTNISHELRTPMTVISGRLETVLNSEIDDKTKNSLSVVLRNAQRVTTLITQLLDFRKFQEGKIKVEATQGDLIPPLRDWVASLQVLAEQAEVSVSLESMDECWGWFDFDKLQKIFTNLITNSIKYTKPGGAVRVILQEEPDAKRDRLVQFVVEDTGIGISSEHLGHIFDRFYRVSEESMAAGAGIGLDLAKKLVDLLGGKIRVESPIHPDAGRPGTRFTVSLPLEAETVSKVECQKVESVAPTESTEPMGSTLSAKTTEAPLILVVEDDEDIRNFIAEGLASVYRVAMAEDGAAGLQLAKEQVPDLIVTDIMMPVMDGNVLCRELKTSPETSHIPVIMLTAKTALESQVEGFKTGADDYITKPFHMVLLQTRIANLLESRRLLREQFCREYPVLTPKIPDNTPDKEFLETAIRVVEENYSEWNFNPDEFANALNMSPSTLLRKLKAIADRTPAAFINEYRMMQAAELLTNTSMTITDIVFGVGYDDHSNFNRVFKKQFGMTPSKYRAAHRHRDS